MWTEWIVRVCMLRKIHLMQTLYNAFASNHLGLMTLRGKALLVGLCHWWGGCSE